jgi:hypothetical protein
VVVGRLHESTFTLLGFCCKYALCHDCRPRYHRGLPAFKRQEGNDLDAGNSHLADFRRLDAAHNIFRILSRRSLDPVDQGVEDPTDGLSYHYDYQGQTPTELDDLGDRLVAGVFWGQRRYFHHR